MSYIKSFAILILVFTLSGCAGMDTSSLMKNGFGNKTANTNLSSNGNDSKQVNDVAHEKTKTSPLASCAKESATALFEKANMEKQVNRTATATAILKASNLMLYKLPISSDAKWVDEISQDISPQREKEIAKKLVNDPFFATVQLTDVISGSPLTIFQNLTPAETYLYETLEKLYVTYPDIYTLSTSLEELQNFKGGKQRGVAAMKANKFKNIEEAVISLVPVNLQKDLKKSIFDLKKSNESVAKKKENIAVLSKDDKAKKENGEKIAVAEAELKELEKNADEKENIMDEFWKKSIAELDTNINDEKMKLVKKIKTVLSVVDDGAILAGCTYTTALAKGYTSLGGFENEMKVLGAVTVVAPGKMKGLMQKRVQRLSKNTLLAIPNIAIGTYMIVRQQMFASKFSDVINKLVKADEENQKAKDEQKQATLKNVAKDTKKIAI